MKRLAAAILLLFAAGCSESAESFMDHLRSLPPKTHETSDDLRLAIGRDPDSVLEDPVKDDDGRWDFWYWHIGDKDVTLPVSRQSNKYKPLVDRVSVTPHKPAD